MVPWNSQDVQDLSMYGLNLKQWNFVNFCCIPVVTYGLLNEQVYKHFLFLHSAIRILVSKSPSVRHIRFAELALQNFVIRCHNLYGSTFNTYNIYGLLHLANDVRCLGNLDTFSAFPYENNMSTFRKYCRKPGLPLPQFFNRLTEMQLHGMSNDSDIQSRDSSSITVSMPHNDDTSCSQYRCIQFNEISLSTDVRDNCCILRDSSICLIFNIVDNGNSYRLSVKKFLEIRDFYNIGIASSSIEVYKCGMLCNDIFYINPEQVFAKCYRMPFWNSATNNEDINESTSSKYIVAAIVHTEKT